MFHKTDFRSSMELWVDVGFFFLNFNFSPKLMSMPVILLNEESSAETL